MPEDNAKIIIAVEEFKKVLCEHCVHKNMHIESKLNDDHMKVRSIQEIEYMLNSKEISPDIKAVLEWVIYKREQL
jgi:hypothetical protein